MTKNLDIKDKGPSLLKYAAHYGAILGLFWMFKYLFKIGAGFSDHIFIYVFYLLNVGTFLLIYIFTFKYKESDSQKKKSLLSCILFVVLICFFASFFEGVIMYAHYKFIDPTYFSKMITPGMDMIQNMPYSPDEKNILTRILSSEFIYIVAGFIGNLFLGLIMGLFMGFFVNSNLDKNKL